MAEATSFAPPDPAPSGEVQVFGWQSQPVSPAHSPRGPDAAAGQGGGLNASLDATLLPQGQPAKAAGVATALSPEDRYKERMERLDDSIQRLAHPREDPRQSSAASAEGFFYGKKQGTGALSSSQSTTATLSGSVSTAANSAEGTSDNTVVRKQTPRGACPKWATSSSTSVYGGKIPIQLKAQDAEPQYIALAERLQAGGEAALNAACRSQCFREAMALQGLEPGDFIESAGLSYERRKRLLALVLQQQDRLLVEPPDTPRSSQRGARVLHRQLRERTERSVERAWQTMQHRQVVSQRYISELDARRSRQIEHAQDKEAKAERVRARDQELAAERMQRQTMRNNKWQAAINLAAELDAARRQNLEVHYAELNARSDSAIAQRDQARQAKCHQLREHFQKVMDTAEWKKKDEALQSWQKAEWLQEMMKRSDRHMEACRVQYEVRMEEKRQTVVEREHEVLRVARMNKYMQQQQQQENDEDAEIFAECVRMRDAIPQRIAERIGEVPC